jgi:glycosyltransferase involved in cell wall biosynthesis
VKITIVAGFLLPVPPVQGGAMEKTWHHLAKLFAAAGHEITFISRRWPGSPTSETLAGVHHLRLLGANHTRYLPLNLLLDFIWGVRVTRALPKADIVITNTVALPVWLHRLKPSAGRVVAVIARLPKGQTRLYGRVHRLLSLSTAVTQRILSENSRLRDRIIAFPLPLNWSLHAAAVAAAARSVTPIVIGYIGRLHPEKGIGLLLSAARQLLARPDLPPWRLRLVGPVAVPAGGGGKTWLKQLCEAHAADFGDRLEITPPEYDPSRLAQIYGTIDIFCYPSLAEQGETFGVAVAEAMATGCVPVVSKIACFAELIREDETGLIFDHRSLHPEKNLADALGQLLADAPRRQRLAARARAHVRPFDYPDVAARLLGELAALLPAPTPPRTL